MAKNAADQFASGNVVGAVGTVGTLLIIVASMGVGEAVIKSPQMLGAAGILLVVFSGLMYLQKIKIQRDILVVLAKGYLDIASAFIQKMNNGIVSADNVNQLTYTILQQIMQNKLL